MLPDDIILSKKPIIAQMLKIHEKTSGGSVLALEKVPKKEVFKYGVIDFQKKKDNFYQIKNLVEKPHPSKAPSNLTVVGRYILNYKVFELLEKQKKGHGNEIQLTDSLISLIDKPGLYGFEFDGNRYDCGNKLGFIEANDNFGLKDKKISKNLRKLLRKIWKLQ